MSTNQHDPSEAPSHASEADRYKYISYFAGIGDATVTASTISVMDDLDSDKFDFRVSLYQSL